jgi:DNA-binding transcriptional ArsR family regulator
MEDVELKRDMDLIRRILIAIEDSDQPDLRTVLHFEDVEQATIGHHLHVLKQAGLVGVVDRSSHGSDFLDVSLTWEGYEFLESIRDPGRWEQANAQAAAVGVRSAHMLVELAREAALLDARRMAGAA